MANNTTNVSDWAKEQHALETVTRAGWAIQRLDCGFGPTRQPGWVVLDPDGDPRGGVHGTHRAATAAAVERLQHG